MLYSRTNQVPQNDRKARERRTGDNQCDDSVQRGDSRRWRCPRSARWSSRRGARHWSRFDSAACIWSFGTCNIYWCISPEAMGTDLHLVALRDSRCARRTKRAGIVESPAVRKGVATGLAQGLHYSACLIHGMRRLVAGLVQLPHRTLVLQRASHTFPTGFTRYCLSVT